MPSFTLYSTRFFLTANFILYLFNALLHLQPIHKQSNNQYTGKQQMQWLHGGGDIYIHQYQAHQNSTCNTGQYDKSSTLQYGIAQ